eukprot:2669478-Prorocentrum_lima.AAC.1
MDLPAQIGRVARAQSLRARALPPHVRGENAGRGRCHQREEQQCTARAGLLGTCPGRTGGGCGGGDRRVGRGNGGMGWTGDT